MRKFLLTLPNGNEKCVSAKNSKTFLRNFCSHYPLEVKSRFGPRFLKIFFLTLATGHEKRVWPPILEELFSLLPPCGLGNRFFKKFIFLYVISADPVYMGEMSTPTTPLRIKMPFGRKSENLFSLLSPIHLDRNEPIGRKKSKKISPLAEKICEKAALY